MSLFESACHTPLPSLFSTCCLTSESYLLLHSFVKTRHKHAASEGGKILSGYFYWDYPPTEKTLSVCRSPKSAWTSVDDDDHVGDAFHLTTDMTTFPGLAEIAFASSVFT